MNRLGVSGELMQFVHRVGPEVIYVNDKAHVWQFLDGYGNEVQIFFRYKYMYTLFSKLLNGDKKNLAHFVSEDEKERSPIYISNIEVREVLKFVNKQYKDVTVYLDGNEDRGYHVNHDSYHVDMNDVVHEYIGRRLLPILYNVPPSIDILEICFNDEEDGFDARFSIPKIADVKIFMRNVTYGT